LTKEQDQSCLHLRVAGQETGNGDKFCLIAFSTLAFSFASLRLNFLFSAKMASPVNQEMFCGQKAVQRYR
jgi:hypothetical protein